jgi:hypothetical protein
VDFPLLLPYQAGSAGGLDVFVFDARTDLRHDRVLKGGELELAIDLLAVEALFLQLVVHSVFTTELHGDLFGGLSDVVVGDLDAQLGRAVAHHDLKDELAQGVGIELLLYLLLVRAFQLLLHGWILGEDVGLGLDVLGRDLGAVDGGGRRGVPVSTGAEGEQAEPSERSVSVAHRKRHKNPIVACDDAHCRRHCGRIATRIPGRTSPCCPARMVWAAGPARVHG